MAKFFLPLIILCLTGWLIVGLMQESEFYDEGSEQKYSVQETSQSSYNDSIELNKYANHQLTVSAGNLVFLIPRSFQVTNQLTNESDAYLQYYRTNPDLGCIIYKDRFSINPTDYNYSLSNYIEATINVSRKNAVRFNMIDSIASNLRTDEEAVIVSFNRTRILDDGSENTRAVTFLATQDDSNLYMIYFYCDSANYNANLEDISNIYAST